LDSKKSVKKQEVYEPDQSLNEMLLINVQHCIAPQDDNPLRRTLLLPERGRFCPLQNFKIV